MFNIRERAQSLAVGNPRLKAFLAEVDLPGVSGGYAVTVPALPGCFTRGGRVEEALERAVEAISVHIAGLESDSEFPRSGSLPASPMSRWPPER